MKIKLLSSVVAATFAFSSSALFAAGELNIFNWGNYTPPDLIEKFEKEFDIKVTLTDYDSNDTALAKVAAGGHGFDIAVPSNSYVPIWMEKGLLLNTRVDLMPNAKNILPQFKDVSWDPGRQYSAPWQWGSTGVSVNVKYYKGDINTSTIVLDPPAELIGQINVVPEMMDVMSMAIWYHGGEICSDDKVMLKKVNDTLLAAKPKWKSMAYGNLSKFASEDILAGVNWNGASFRARLQNENVHYGHPKEGYPLWQDAVVVLAEAKNVENAKIFQNFIMLPENAAMMSAFARYANGIIGSEPYMPADMLTAPEIVVSAELAAKGKFLETCSPAVNKIYTKIWTNLMK
jgi:spermidine/putrescine transport system substrate-binding protein